MLTRSSKELVIFSVGTIPSGVTNSLPSWSKVAHAKMTCCALLADFARRRFARMANDSSTAQAPIDYDNHQTRYERQVRMRGKDTSAMTMMTVWSLEMFVFNETAPLNR